MNTYEVWESEDFGDTFELVDTIMTDDIEKVMQEQCEELFFEDWTYDVDLLEVSNSSGFVVRYKEIE